MQLILKNYALLGENFLFRLSLQIKPLNSTTVFMTEKWKSAAVNVFVYLDAYLCKHKTFFKRHDVLAIKRGSITLYKPIFQMPEMVTVFVKKAWKE